MPVLVNRFIPRSFHGKDTHQLQRTGKNPEEERLLEEQEDDDSALLSSPEWRDYWKKPEYSTLGYFQHRERLLRRILRDNPLADQIRRRERSVRFLHYHQNTPQRVKAKQHMLLTELLVKSEGEVSYWKDFWIFEWHSFIPATYCLLVHCIAHSAWDDFIAMFIGAGFFAGVVGILLLRLTGDLYWWMDDDSYDALRVDFHNRRRLGGDLEMEWSKQIRRRTILRAFCFMFGYSICALVSVSVNQSIEKLLFDEYEHVVSSLPSALNKQVNGMCPAAVSFCSPACQDYLKERETFTSAQAQADLIHTWKTLTAEGYDELWYASIDDSSTPAITTSRTHFLYSIVSATIAISLYWFLLRGRFWEKY